ncbi:MAG: Oxidoreductase, family [Myxococcaceae bacterium]|nr:Oxidoreductase, family [Myxococcaceae bacterium]
MTTQPLDHEHGHVHGHADEDLPEGSVIDGEALTRSIDDVFDVVIVGSGAAGATAAHTLTAAGLSVGIVEEGPWLKTKDVTKDVHTAFGRVMRQSGMQVLQGRAYMPLLQGRCVGGSTLVNSAIAWRIPEDVVDEWAARFGLGASSGRRGITMQELEPHFDALERDLSVREVDPSVLGENNRLFVEQAKKHGFDAAPMRRYDRGCKGSGMCLTGCPNAAKQGMSVTYVPWSLQRGARIFTSCAVEHVEIVGGRAVAVRARSESGHLVTVRARRAVLVAASTVQSPNILRRSGLRFAALGRHFQAHPGLAIGGLFPSGPPHTQAPIRMAFGATQGAESTHYRRSDRFKLETISLPPDLAGARIPGVGRELTERLSQLSNVAVWAAQVRAEAEGIVTSGWGGADRVKYTMTTRDLEAARKACTLIARMLFEGGAREVWPGIYGVPSVLRSIDEVRHLENAPLEPRSYNFIATHLFGAARMGPDPRTSVVDLDFQVHGVAGLHVVDSSVFPTNLGVNPQHSIMAMSRLAATRIAERADTRTRASRIGRAKPLDEAVTPA